MLEDVVPAPASSWIKCWWLRRVGYPLLEIVVPAPLSSWIKCWSKVVIVVIFSVIDCSSFSFRLFNNMVLIRIKMATRQERFNDLIASF